MNNNTHQALETLLITLHQAATLWSIAENTKKWGKGIAKFLRPIKKPPIAILLGTNPPSQTAHAKLTAAHQKAQALTVFTTITTLLDTLPCFNGSAFSLEISSPTITKKPTFSCCIDGIALGNTTTKQTASSIARKLIHVAELLAPLDWEQPRQWMALENWKPTHQPLLAPNLESAQIKMVAIQQAGTRENNLLKERQYLLDYSQQYYAMAEIHEHNIVRKTNLLDLIQKNSHK